MNGLSLHLGFYIDVARFNINQILLIKSRRKPSLASLLITAPK
jgi:hypothetical protein